MNVKPLTIRVNRVDLTRIDELDDALELMYFGLRGMTRDADDLLGRRGLSRSHHRILFVVARRDGISVGELRAALGVSAQAMHRPLKQLADTGMIAVSRDPTRHRYKALHLTQRGREIEDQASGAERRVDPRGVRPYWRARSGRMGRGHGQDCRKRLIPPNRKMWTTTMLALTAAVARYERPKLLVKT